MTSSPERSRDSAPEGVRGTVYGSAGGVYDVRLDDGHRVEARLRGRVKKAARAGSRVVVGDRVSVSRTDDAWTIESVADRVTELARRGRAGRAPKVLAANLDRVFAVVALRSPPASTELIDRLLVLIESSGMHPILVLNKLDLPGGGEAAVALGALYESAGYQVIATSAATGEGLEGLRDLVRLGSSAFIGPSGVGKSSLLNALEPDLDLRTSELSRKTGTGRHTTVGSRLIPLECGGVVADTPGFGDVGLWSVPAEEIAACFPELRGPAGECRFRGCSHLHEPGCGVRAALGRGEISESRYESYRTLCAEAEPG